MSKYIVKSMNEFRKVKTTTHSIGDTCICNNLLVKAGTFFPSSKKMN